MIKPGQVYTCRCGAVNPKYVDNTNPKELLHMTRRWVREYDGEAGEEWDVCGKLELDVLLTFKKLVEINNESK